MYFAISLRLILPNTTKQKALFLDRDGVINRDIGYACDPGRIDFLPGIFEFCQAFQVAGYLLIVGMMGAVVGMS